MDLVKTLTCLYMPLHTHIHVYSHNLTPHFHLPSCRSAVSSLNIPVFSHLNRRRQPSIDGATHQAGDRGTPGRAGQYVVQAHSVITSKVVPQDTDLEFVEMADMLPDFWQDEAQRLVVFDTQLTPRRVGRKVLVQDISQWTECFSRMAAVLVARYPNKSPELWAYQASIVRVAHNFEGTAWVAYDWQYRREAFASRDLDWLQPNARLYSKAFTGHAKAIPRCHHCLSDSHTTSACSLEPTLGSNPVNTGTGQSTQPSQEVCRLYNAGCCHHPRCRYRHVCQDCAYQHPWMQCPRNYQRAGRERSPHRPGTGRT